jgi:hypothetical protein
MGKAKIIYFYIFSTYSVVLFHDDLFSRYLWPVLYHSRIFSKYVFGLFNSVLVLMGHLLYHTLMLVEMYNI